ncbi:MAG TPA: MoxR family ATPase, partial [Geobacterales bacterium]|nr:MoxR family ATPase [Geobacterales bacterium]
EIEKKIVANIDEIEQLKIKPVLTLSDAIRLIDEAKGIKISERILDYILNIIEQIRNDKRIRLPPSPRASIWLYKIGRVFAYLDGRNYMIPDDVKRIAHEVLRHRIYLKTEWELEGIEPDTIIRETLESVAVPRE